MAALPHRRQAVPTARGRGPVPRPRAGGGTSAAGRSTQSFSVRFFGAGLAAAELMTCYLGLEIGAYDALSGSGPLTAAELARRAGLDERMAREWLEQQASAGILLVDGPERVSEQAPEERRFTLPPEHAEALLDPDSPNWIAPLVVMPIGGMASVLPQLVAAYRNREGLAPSAYGQAMRDGQANLNRGVFQHLLAGWISRHLPDIEARLHVPGAAITDVACGSGLSTLELARAFPLARVHGVDLDPASIAAARRRLAGTDLGDRVSFGSGDAADQGADAAGSGPEGAGGPGPGGTTGQGSLLVCVFDALHDMSRPVEVLRACREMLAPGGAVLLMEPSVAERFTAEPDDSERFHYAVSVLHCLPVGMSDTPSAATGTVMRPDTVRAYAREAGLEAEVIDVGHLFYRLYRLRAA